MPRAQLTIDIPAEAWIADVSAHHPDVRFEILTAMRGEESGIAQVRLDVADPLPVITEIRGRDDVDELDLLWKYEDEALLQIQSSNPLLLLPVWRSGVPLTTPFEIQDEQATWELTTSSNRLSRLRTQLSEFGIGFTIDYVRDIDASQADQLLTDRQQEVIASAVQEGYYRSPREATLGEVADTLDIANATCSDILHRAEGHIIHWFIEHHMELQPE
jgi:hypothetical protein